MKLKFLKSKFVIFVVVVVCANGYYFFQTFQRRESLKDDTPGVDNIALELQKQTALRKEIESKVEQIRKDYEKIKDENQVLRQKLKEEKVKNAVDKKSKEYFSKRNSRMAPEPSLEEEVLKKKIKNDAIELLYSIRSKLTKLPDTNVSQLKQKVLKDLFAQHVGSTINIQKLLDLNEDWKQREMKELQDLVQNRIRYSQNPSSCSRAKKLSCSLPACGFGCQLHHLGYCFMVAYGSNRTMIVEKQRWNGQEGGWQAVFEPISKTCTERTSPLSSTYDESKQDELELHFPLVNALPRAPTFSPQAIPSDIAFRLKRLHRQPGVWWVGQFIKYLFRGRDVLKSKWIAAHDQVGFDRPIVGIHVRGTDKITWGEASIHNLKEYMDHVAIWYDAYEIKHEQEGKVKRRVYLATDRPSIIEEAEEKYKDYEFINFKAFSQLANDPQARNSLESLRGITTDIYILSHCNYIVCTLSSQVCRTAYELKQTLKPDATFDVQSIDDVYYYGGQRDHLQTALFDHEPDPENDEMELRVGDTIILAGNHWDGYSKGRNKRTNKFALYPSWKVEDVIDEIKYPIYPGSNDGKH